MTKKSDEQIKQALAKKHACYVLITCGAPSEDGKMNVEMTYEGDDAVAAYLVQGAQIYMDQKELSSDFKIPSSNKIHSLKSK